MGVNIQKQPEKAMSNVIDLGTYLETMEWHMWATITSRQELTMKSGRRLNNRIGNALQKLAPCRMFYALEYFDVKDGSHSHNLIHFNGLIVPTFEEVGKTIRKHAGLEVYVHASTYREHGGACGYLTKYVSKQIAETDYDFILPGRYKDTRPTSKHRPTQGEHRQKPTYNIDSKPPIWLQNYYESNEQIQQHPTRESGKSLR